MSKLAESRVIEIRRELCDLYGCLHLAAHYTGTNWSLLNIAKNATSFAIRDAVGDDKFQLTIRHSSSLAVNALYDAISVARKVDGAHDVTGRAFSLVIKHRKKIPLRLSWPMFQRRRRQRQRVSVVQFYAY